GRPPLPPRAAYGRTPRGSPRRRASPRHGPRASRSPRTRSCQHLAFRRDAAFAARAVLVDSLTALAHASAAVQQGLDAASNDPLGVLAVLQHGTEGDGRGVGVEVAGA